MSGKSVGEGLKPGNAWAALKTWALGRDAVATPVSYNPRNFIELAHEALGHSKYKMGHFQIRLWGPLLALEALTWQLQSLLSKSFRIKLPYLKPALVAA